MIKANELKIGNLIKVGKNIAKVNGSLLNYCDSGTEVPEFYPIPLTPEILKKAGFEFKDMMFANAPMQYWRKDWFVLNLFKDGTKYICYLWNEKESQKDVYLSSLHQLQNLYFALTGEELEINL